MKPVNNVLLILNFSPVLPVYSTLEKQPALPEYSHEHLLFFFFFFVGGLCPSWYTYALGAGFRSVSVINFPIFVCIPLLIDLRWNSSSSVSNSWLNKFPALKKNHQPVPDKMEYASVATVTRCRRSPTEKHQLQMATNTDLNPGRLLPAVKDGTEFSAGPKNGSY